MLVLRSPQGTGKSTALALLCPTADWFSDDLPLGADTKVAIERLQGRWIVEAAELTGMRTNKVEQLKAFLSRQVDRARMAYGRITSEVPRQCIFIGTTNSERFLRDSTGDRRFWPVAVGEFDLVGLKRDRDQLWAEAAHREAQGETIRLDPSLYPAATENQDDHRIEDPYETQLADVLGAVEGKLRNIDAWQIIGVPSGQRTQDHNERLGASMRRLGWERSKRRFGGAPEWCYVRGRGSLPQIEVVVVEGQPKVVPF
jgi:predicted P-loop ATPase